MSRILIVCIVSLFILSCSGDNIQSELCPTNDFFLNACDKVSDIDYHVLEALASSYGDTVLFVQEMVPYDGQAGIDYLPDCVVQIDSQFIKLIVSEPDSYFLCPDSLPGMIVSMEEINCVLKSGGLKLFQDRFGSTRYLEVSPPVVDENGLAYIIYHDSRCSIESAILQNIDGVWEVICQRQVAIC